MIPLLHSRGGALGLERPGRARESSRGSGREGGGFRPPAHPSRRPSHFLRFPLRIHRLSPYKYAHPRSQLPSRFASLRGVTSAHPLLISALVSLVHSWPVGAAPNDSPGIPSTRCCVALRRSTSPAVEPDWVHQVAAPNVYRGRYNGDDAGGQYANLVSRAAADAPGGKVAAFFVESGMSVAGVILPPAGYLKAVFAAVREAGGVCVAGAFSPLQPLSLWCGSSLQLAKLEGSSEASIPRGLFCSSLFAPNRAHVVLCR